MGSQWRPCGCEQRLTWCLSLLPALTLPALFCVDRSALNRIIKLSNIFFFPSSWPHVSVLVKKEENNSILILSSTSYDLTTLKTHLSLWLLGFQLPSALKVTSSVSSLLPPLKNNNNNNNNKKPISFWSGINFIFLVHDFKVELVKGLFVSLPQVSSY